MGRSIGSSTNNLSLSLGSSPHGFVGKVKDAYDKMMFGVLYSMVHGNNFSRKFLVLNIIVEFIQLLSFCFRSVFPWQRELTYLGFSLSFFRLPDDLFSYQAYTVVFWLVFVFVWLSIANAALVGYGFHHEAYRFIWSIRTLRWVTSVLVSVLYIPVVIIFLTALSCSPGSSLLSFFSDEGVPCWGAGNAIKAVAGIVTLIVFTPFAFANCSTYYEHDPTVKFTYAHAHSRFDVLMLALKTVLTVCFAFGETIPWLLCLTTVFGILIGLLTSLLYMPVYNHRLNQMKTCSLAVVFWASLSIVVCLAVKDPKNTFPTYFFVAGIVPSFGAGYFLHKWRVRSLFKICQLMTTPKYDVEQSTSKGTTKVVTWATPVPAFGMLDSATAEAAASKLRFSAEVEIVARFVLDEPNGVTNETLQRAETIYRAGIKRFPHAAMVLMQYIIFLMVYKKDTQRGFALLEKLRKRNSGFFDVRFFIFRQDKDRERKVQLEGMGGEKGKFDDFVGYMQYQKLYNQARQGHLEVLKLVQKFWKLLLEDEVDMARLAGQAGKIATAEQKTEKLYLTLLNLYPQSPRLLRDFAQFVDDILQEEDLVRFLVERADYFEETASKSRSKSPRKSDRKNDDDDEEKGHNDDDDLFEDKSMLASSAELSHSSLQRKKMAMLNKNDNASLKILSFVLIGCTLISIMLATATVVTVVNQIGQYNHDLNRVVSASLMSTLGAQLAVDARTTAAHARALDVNYTYKKDQDSLARRSVIYKNILQAIAWGQDDLIPFTPDKFKLVAGLTDTTIDVGSRVFTYSDYNISGSASAAVDNPTVHKLFYEPSLDIVMTSFDLNGAQSQENYKWGFWAAGRLFSEYAQLVGTYNYSKLINIDKTSEEYNFVVLNGGTGIAEGLALLVDALTGVATNGLHSVMTTTYVNYAVAAFVTIITGVFVFRPVVLKVVSQKSHTLNLFLKVPPEVVQKMVRRNGQLIKSFKVSLDGPQIVADAEGEFAIEESEDNEEEISYPPLSTSHIIVSETSDIMMTRMPSSNPLSQTQTTLNESTQALIQSQNLNDSQNLGMSSETAPLLQIQVQNQNQYQNPSQNQTKNQNQNQTNPVIVTTHSSGSSSGNISARMQQRTQNNATLTKGFIWLHLNYTLGLLFILCCFSALLIAVRFTVDDVNPAAHSINLAAVRARAIKSIGNDMMGFILPETRNISRILLQKDVDLMLRTEQQVESLVSDLNNAVGLDDLYNSKCLLEVQSKCVSKTNKYYDSVSQGLSHLVYRYAEATKRVMSFSDAQLKTAIYNSDVNWILNMSANDLVEGGNRFTRQLSVYWTDKISLCKQLIGGISGIIIFLFIVEYFVFFRRLLSRLRNESQNTYAMLQMIPKKELAAIRELFELTNNM